MTDKIKTGFFFCMTINEFTLVFSVRYEIILVYMVGSTLAQTVRRRPFTAEASFRSQSMRFLVDIVALGQVFLRVLRFSTFSIIPLVLHIHLHLYVAV